CSHDNASKDYTNQPIALQTIADQIAAGSHHLMGVMIESHLKAGNQKLPKHLGDLVYGQSITDACVDFATTETMLRSLAGGLAKANGQEKCVVAVD
ncbi:MAG: 3-deoxy-7-phosphoheptulonate synthase, partial [Verrucomicrobia bacterium]|nr:3-deoxy-7-phosphoheptulonate synthase [Leptolyngbya sp. ES-bin-22]